MLMMTILYNIFYFCLGFGVCLLLLFYLSLFIHNDSESEKLREKQK